MSHFAFIAVAAWCLLMAGGPARAGAPAGELKVGSARAIVVDEATGEVLLDKNASAAAPIASLTKLMTAMVVLDARQDPNEELRIDDADTDRLKHTRSGVPVGAVLTRTALLELALMASDNRAAAALARNYPGGNAAFLKAVRRKIQSLEMTSTSIEEPTGLSPYNVSSAQDMARLLRAAAGYDEISRITSQYRHVTLVNGEPRPVRNTNWLLGEPGWEILLSKTGFTREAGRCLTMRMRAAGRTVLMVLMGADGSTERIVDAMNIRRWLGGASPAPAVMAAVTTMPVPSARRRAASARIVLAKAVAPRSHVAADADGGYRRGDGALQPTSAQLAALAALAAAPAAAAQEGGSEETSLAADAADVDAADAEAEADAEEADTVAVLAETLERAPAAEGAAQQAEQAADVQVSTGDEGE